MRLLLAVMRYLAGNPNEPRAVVEATISGGSGHRPPISVGIGKLE